jgi:hypothetical protein
LLRTEDEPLELEPELELLPPHAVCVSKMQMVKTIAGTGGLAVESFMI